MSLTIEELVAKLRLDNAQYLQAMKDSVRRLDDMEHSMGQVGKSVDKMASSMGKSGKDVKKNADSIADSYGNAFKTLGVKSDASFSDMRKSAVNAYQEIANHAKSTSADIIRAEEAKNKMLRHIQAEQVNKQTSMLTSLKQNWLATAAIVTTTYMAVSKAMSSVSDVALKAARYETLGVVMATVGKNAKYTSVQMEANAQALQKLGISMTVSREATIKTVQAHIALSDSLKLARIAQDAAVIGNTNSSEALERMFYGIQTAQIEVLKSIGINVNFENSYKKIADQLGKTSDELTEGEKLQARLNVVMAAGKDIAGTYEAAMTTAGKQLNSFARYVDDFKVKMGEAFGPATSQLVMDATAAMKHFTEIAERKETQQSLKDIASGISTIAGAAISVAEKLASVIGWIGALSSAYTEFMDKYKADWEKAAAEGSEIALPKIKEGVGSDSLMEEIILQKQKADAIEKVDNALKKYFDSIEEMAVAEEQSTTKTKAFIEQLKQKALLLKEGEGASLRSKLATMQMTEKERELANSYIDAIVGVKAKNKEESESVRLAKQKEKEISSYIDKLKKETAQIGMSAVAIKKLEARQMGLTGARLKEVEALISQADAEEALWKAAQAADAAMGDNILDGMNKAVQYEEERKREADQLLQDKMELYKDLIGFEDEYREVQIEWIAKIRDAEIKAGLDKEAAYLKYYQSIGQLDSDLFQEKGRQVEMALGDMAAGFDDMSHMFAENSKNYNRMQDAAEAMIILQKGVAVVNAVAAVAASAAAPWPAGFVSMAAMIGAMGSLLGSIGASIGGGGSTTVAPVAPSPTNYSGTVLGDQDASSESILNVYDALMDIHADEYPELQRIRQEMVELNNNITGLTSSIIRSNGTFDAEQYLVSESMFKAPVDAIGKVMNHVLNFLPDWIAGLMDPVSSLLGKYAGDFVSSVLGGSIKTRKLEEGYTIGDTSVNSLLQGGNLDVQQYATWRFRKDGGLLGDDKVWPETKYAEVDEDIQRLFTMVFAGMGRSMKSLGESLGYDAKAIEDYVFKIGNIDLMGLDADEMSEKLSSTFSTALDVAFNELMPAIKVYQQIGEGLFETAARLVIDKEIILASLEAINIGFEGAANSLAAVEFTQALLGFAEDMDTLTSDISNYFSAFFSEQEQFDWTSGQLHESMANLNLSLPATRDGFRDLVESLDLTTDTGKRAFVSLMGLSDAADDFYSAAEEIEEALKKVEESFRSISDSLDDSIAKMTMEDYDYEKKSIQDAFADSMRAAADEFGIGSEKFNELSVKYAKLRDLQLAALDKKRYDQEVAAAISATQRIGSLTQSIDDSLSSFGMDEWQKQMDAAGKTVAGWQGQIAELVASGDLLPEQAKILLDRTQEWLDLTTEGIEKNKHAQEVALEAEYRTFQMGLTGQSDSDITVANIAAKRGWGDSYGTPGNFNIERLYKEQVLPFINMGFEEFKENAELNGLTWQELSEDITSLSDVFNALQVDAEALRDSWKSLAASLSDTISSLKTSDANPADVYERLNIAAREIDVATANFAGLTDDGDKQAAIENISGLWQNYLSIGQEAFARPSDEYQQIFDAAINGLSGMQSYADNMATAYDVSVQSRDYLAEIAGNTSFLAQIPSYAGGGVIEEDALAFVHQGEIYTNDGSTPVIPISENGSGETVIQFGDILIQGSDNPEETARIFLQRVRQELPYILSRDAASRRVISNIPRSVN